MLQHSLLRTTTPFTLMTRMNEGRLFAIEMKRSGPSRSVAAERKQNGGLETMRTSPARVKWLRGRGAIWRDQATRHLVRTTERAYLVRKLGAVKGHPVS